MSEITNLEKQVLDKGLIRVIDVMGTDSSVVDAARVSYGKGTRSVSDDRVLIRYLMMHKHTSPFEMCEIKLYVKVPMFVARQWVRHRTANFNEYSARYSEMPNEFYYPSHEMLQKQSLNNKQCSEGQFSLEEYEKILSIMKTATENSYEKYTHLLELEVARETARGILPVNIYTQFYWKIDAHNLMHFLKLRCEQNAQQEMRAYAHAILDIFAQWMPITYEAFMDYVVKAETYSSHGHEVLKQSIDQEKAMNLIEADEVLSKREKGVLRGRLGKL